jgi:hypothetical protein
MYDQLDLEVIPNFSNIERTSDFHEFWNEVLHYGK